MYYHGVTLAEADSLKLPFLHKFLTCSLKLSLLSILAPKSFFTSTNLNTSRPLHF